jgi:hypothetical protein
MHINSCHDLEHVVVISAGGICKAQTTMMVIYVLEALTGVASMHVLYIQYKNGVDSLQYSR